MCYRCAEEQEEKIDDAWEICDSFSYTLKSFGIVNRVIRSFWATSLYILLSEGSEAAQEYRDDFFREP